MKKLLLTGLIIWCISGSLHAQERNKVVYDSLKNQMVIEGLCDRAFLEGFSPFNLHYADEYRNYVPDMENPTEVINMMDSVSITVVLGTWCGDSREQVPRFFKVIDDIGYPSESITLIGVNGKKTAGHYQISHLAIEKVPTFILLTPGGELGRITETPAVSLEADLMAILKGKKP